MSLRIYQLCLVPALAAALAAGACTAQLDRQRSLPLVRAVTDEDVAVEIQILAQARDPGGDALTLVAASAIGHRVEIKGGGILVVTPKPDYFGSIDVAFEVSDHHGRSATGTAVVTVRPVNDAPVASGGSRNVHGSDAIVLDGQDVDGDPLSYAIASGPAHGVLTGSPPVMQYTPDPGFVGDDAITYRVSDGALSSAAATLQLHVGPGEPPVALTDTVTVDEDHALELILHATDADGDALKFAIVTPPASGALAGTPPHLIYTPGPEFSGDDAVVFSVSDGYLASGNATVTIHVTPVNDAPVAVAQAVDAVEDTGRAITLAGRDVEGDQLGFQIKDAPAHGTLAGSGATVTYQPALNYHGPDRFTFVAFDGKLASAPATVAIAVAAVDDPPVATSFQVTLAEDAAGAPVALLGGDVDGDALGYALGSPPAHGTLLGTPPALIYVPDPNFHGSDSFTYTVSAGGATSAAATVTLKVTPINHPPVAGELSLTSHRGRSESARAVM
ncbi:MAG TPA: Ig-like domain-containing protein [Kofleriaceae bacterium]|nr:Ig-like domain-containing protein [Kofleriaceae bacterium]